MFLIIFLKFHFFAILMTRRSGAAVVVTKYIFGAFEDFEKDEEDGKIFGKESRVAQALAALPSVAEKAENVEKEENETHP
jgi:hypothetical protein